MLRGKNKRKRNNLGSAITLVLIFAFLMLVIAVAYGKLTQTSKGQSVQIDERLRIDYAMESISELALLKYQLYPADYYICRKLKKDPYNNSTYYNMFIETNPTVPNTPFFVNDNSSRSHFNDNPVHVELCDIEIVTTNQWNTEAIIVTSHANYTDMFHRSVDKTNTRLYEVQRYTDTSLIEVSPSAP